MVRKCKRHGRPARTVAAIATICLSLASCAAKRDGTALLKEADFARVADGRQTRLITLRNASGAVAQFSDYGGRWLSMWVPDADGRMGDVVLGFDRLDGYMTAAEGYHGAITGRVCGRIKGGGFSLDGETYRLANNDMFGSPVKNHLHGGVNGFHKKVWASATGTDDRGDAYVDFHYLSPDGEEGYPGNLMVKVRYTLTADNAMEIDYRAVTDKPTIVNLTNHAFFNLSGDPSRDVSGHILWLNAGRYVECDDELVPTGNIPDLKGLPIDFTSPAPVGARLDADLPEIVKGKGFAVAYLVDLSDGEMTRAAKMTDPATGRTMEVYTNQPSLQVYNAWLMNGSDAGKGGIPYGCGAGIVIETQGVPDAPNHPSFPQVTLRPGEMYHHKAIYAFGVEKIMT